MSVTNRRKRERQERRLCIIDAAEAVFAQKGFDQATMDDIASTADLSKGTLYLYFKSKDDLFIALASRISGHLVERFEEMAEGSLPGVDTIRAMLGAYAEFLIARPQLFRVLTGRLISGAVMEHDSPSFQQHRSQVERIAKAFESAIERGKRDGSLRPDIESRQTATQIWGGLLGTLLLRINGEHFMSRFPKPVDFTRFVDGYIDLVCNGLTPHHPETAS